MLRTSTDKTPLTKLRRGFQELGYPWRGETDPYEHFFVTWVDGKSGLGGQTQDLFRARQQALLTKRFGVADDVRDELRELGVAVRDRDDAQQYRVVPHQH